MGLLSWLNRIVERRVQAALAEERAALVKTQATLKWERQRQPREDAALAPTYEERIQGFIPRIFQRTPAHFVPAGAGTGVHEGTGLDAAPAHVREMIDVYGIQPGIPAAVMGWYAAQSFIGHQTSAILAQHWLIKKACLVPARDAVRKGYKVNLTAKNGSEVPPEAIKELERIDKKHKIIKQCRELVYFARVFGVRHALFEVDGLDYTAPFNIDGVRPGSYRGISQIDPYWLMPELDIKAMSDPSWRHFYEPTYWRLPDGRRVHHSHLVIVKTSEVADVLKPTYNFGGIPLPQEIYNRVYAAERVADEAPELALTKRLITMTGSLENYIANTSEVTERLEAFNQVRNNHGFLITDEEEQVQQHDTSLADFDALLMSQYQLVAAIANVPATKLIETSPKGFNATGDHESENYGDELESIQTNDMEPLVDRHHEIAARSGLNLKYGLEFQMSVNWNPTRTPRPEEIADLNLKKSQTGQALVGSGAITEDEERDRVKNDPDSGYSGIGEREEEELEDYADLLEGEAGFGLDAGNFKEEAHKRDNDGKFSGSSGAEKAVTTSEAEKQQKIDSIKLDLSKDNTLPGLNAETLQELGGIADKPVLLKKNIIEKNKERHPDVDPAEYANIIGRSLYKPDAVVRGHQDKPYFNFLSSAGANKSSITLLEVAETKNNYEIINMHWLGGRQRKQKERK